jgi:hypothetical protein
VPVTAELHESPGIPPGAPAEELGASGINIVDEASEESFPASDPPAYTPNTSLGPPCPDEPVD